MFELMTRKRYRELARREVRNLVFQFPDAAGEVLDRLERGEVFGWTYQTCIYGSFVDAAGLPARDAEDRAEQARTLAEMAREAFGLNPQRLSPLEAMTASVVRGDTPANHPTVALVAAWMREAKVEHEILQSRVPRREPATAHV